MRLLLVAVLLPACALGARLREDASVIEKKIASAMELGARSCAPVELATAQTHLEFLRYELDEGDFRRASFHREKSLANVSRALEVTVPERCADFLAPFSADDRDGDGIPDEADACPDVPEDIDGDSDQDGCPEDERLDQDGDGVLDSNDACPTEAEDVDLFEDEDGCPDVDNDGDTVLDVADACPIEPGSPERSGCPSKDRDSDGVVDDLDQCPDVPGKRKNGCPERVLVEMTGTTIEIKRQILFETANATIRGRVSFDVLDQVAAVMRSNPEIKVSIEGHTDSRGNASSNQELSIDRANSVRGALIERGVSEGRLSAVGYGETKPLASNRTRKGRAANRRVEFNIVQSGAN